MLFVRALISFLALPGIVAFAIPLYAFDTGEGFDAFATGGLVVLLTGIFILGWCVRDFYVLGRGTLAPWDPPKNLVVLGLYRYSRNPMYVGVLTILA
jgi:protein-S-isoprenylcysteine O-methyltransferase Ste14